MEFLVRVLLCFTCLCFQDFVFCDDYAEMGGRITFSPSIRGKPVEIMWKHNGDKVLEYDNSEMEQYGSFRDRVELDFETGQLTIKKLTSQDGGQYQSDIMINGKVQSSRHTLTVLDVLPDPRVTCEVNETSNLQELLCSVDYKTPLQYKWSGPNVIDHPGAELIIIEQQKNSDSIYSCTVKNEVSSKTTDFNLQDCVTGAAARLEVILPVVLVILLLIFLIILAVFIYRKKKSRGSKQKKKDPENASSEASPASQTALMHQKDSDKKQDEDNGSDNTGENEESAKLLNHSGNEEQRSSNENSLHTDVVVENASSKPEETLKQKHPEDQDEEEEGQRQKLENGNEMGELTIEQPNKKLEEFKIDDADNENNVKIPGEKKEEKNNVEKDQQITGLSEAISLNQMRLMHQKDSDKKQDEDNESDNTGENEERAKLLNHSGNEEERYSNEYSLHAVLVEENASSKPEETLKQKHPEDQDEEEEGQRQKLDNKNKMGTMSIDYLTEKLEGLNIHHTDNNDKISEEKIKEGNKEEKDQQSTELSGVRQDLATQETSTAQSSNSQKHKEENQKPEKRNESGETSAQQQNEGVKTEVTARNEDQPTTGANTQEEDHEETRESDTDSASYSEKPPIHNNSDAFCSQNDLSADTENKTVKSDNKENVGTKAEHDDDDAKSVRNEETPEVKTEEEDDHNRQRDKSSEPKQEDMENNDPPDAGVNKRLKDDEVKNPELDQRKDDDDLSVPEDKQQETQSDNFQKQEHLSSTERE